MNKAIGQYTILEKLYESQCMLVYRGSRIKDSLPVILKVLKPGFISAEEKTRFKHEYETISKLSLPGVTKVLALENNDSGLVMVLKDIGGESLDRILKKTPLPLDRSLEIMIALTDAVGLIHKQHIIHKDINPSNIIYNPHTKEVEIIDFGIADEAPERSVPPQSPSALEGTLEYISPEQTGRMNRPVDYRTDFYSLGVTFYRMLTGRLAFEADDALGMVYAHIARTPVPPHEIDSSIPEMVSRIVMKLMAKMADDRYQSAWGLKVDLERCLRELKDEGVVYQFELGLGDYSERLHVPQKLYGREKEIDQMFKAFNRTSAGERELLLIAGYAGVGKTRLVHEMYRPIAEKHGYFIEGKFDQLQHNVPYFGWIQAFSGLVRYLLTESESRLVYWREAILDAVGVLGKILIDIIPDLELIIGPQPEVPALGPSEAQNRFNYVFLEFIKALARSEHPLVVFLDDLQWIDPASLNLLQTLMGSVGVSNILVIGAYRDNEVNALHPLSIAIEALEKEQARVDMLTLANLSEKTVNELIADTLHCEHSETIPLTSLIYSKTGGNPFFLLQTLKTLVEGGAIAFDIQNNRWKWNTSTLKAMGITDNVVALMLRKIRNLPLETRYLLSLAACMGFKFGRLNLSIITNQSEDTTLEELQPALREGLIVDDGPQYQFVHDRVQQAAHSLIPDAERKDVHLKIGRLLLSRYPQEALAERVFDIVDQFNRSVDIVTDADERATLRQLNMAAGRKARAAIAYASGRSYLEQAMALLPENSWKECYTESLALFLELAECEYLVGNYLRSEALLTTALEMAGSTLDLASIHRLRMRLYQLSGCFNAALEAAFEGLGLFGLTFPAPGEDVQAATEAEVRLIQENLRGRRIIDLLDISLASDAETRILVGLLADTVPVVFLVRTDIWSLFTANAVNICLQRGHGDESSFLYASYAMASAADIRNILTAQQFSEMAIELNARTPGAAPVRGKTLFLHAATVNIWRNRISTSLPLLDQAFRASLDYGELVYGSYTTMVDIWMHLENGDPLECVLETARRSVSFARENHNSPVYNVNRVQQHFAMALQGNTSSLTDFNGTEFDEAESIAMIEQAGFMFGVAFYNVMKQICSFLDGRYQEALEWAIRASSTVRYVSALVNEATHYFYHALTLAALHAQAPAEQQEQFTQTIREILGKLKLCADYCPENFGNRYFLVSAEIARVEGRPLDAMQLYEQAIVSARENGFVHHEAVAYEIAAAFYRQRGLDTIFQAYLSKAVACYTRWGATGKVKQLERLHPWLATAEQQKAGTVSERLDVESLAKAQQAISSKIEMDKLLNEVMQIVIENAGAEIGFLLLEQDEVWQIVAKGGIGIAEVKVPIPISVDESGLVSQSVVRFVARTKEIIVLDDASNRGEFVNDPHIRDEKSKSLLCTPLLSRGRLIGILYLENNLTTQAFSPERVKLLKILLSQAAISIENARIYESLQSSEAKYRRLVDTANEGIWALGPDTMTTFINARMAEMLGFTTEEMIGRPLTDFMFKEDASDHLRRMKNSQLGTSEHFERRFRKKNGQTVWTLASVTPILDQEGRFQGAFGMHTDMTEHKQFEDRQREFYRRTILAATEGKLQLTEREEIESIAGPLIAAFKVENAEDFRSVRSAILNIALSLGMDEVRAGDYRVAVGEAVTNAIKHAGWGTVSIHARSESILTVISDNGPGIESMSIPEVALKKGYTTAGTLGMGYKVMTSITDKVYLATGPSGTTVGIDMSIRPIETKLDINTMYHSLK